MPKITKRAVDALKPAERERVVWDDDVKGFGVRVHPAAARSTSSSTATRDAPSRRPSDRTAPSLRRRRGRAQPRS